MVGDARYLKLRSAHQATRSFPTRDRREDIEGTVRRRSLQSPTVRVPFRLVLRALHVVAGKRGLAGDEPKSDPIASAPHRGAYTRG
jgi:hypothetical protein